ncbi:MAG: hypothetical protein LQ341_007818, partial [Variospora aurantia]
QETTIEQATQKETTAAKAESTVIGDEETTTGASEKKDTRERGKASSNSQRQYEQQARAKSNVGKDDARVAAARVADPLADEAAQITESADDTDQTIANRIVIPDVDCEVSGGATVTVRDADGTEITLTDGVNVDIEQGQGRIVIVGSGEDGNFDGVVIIGGDFGPSDSTETGAVVRSTGITCNNDGNNGGGSDGNTDGEVGNAEGCDGARIVESISGTGNQQSSPFDTDGALFRVTSKVTATSDPDLIFFSVDVRDENGNPVATVDQEQPGTQSSFVNEGAGRFFLDVAAANVEYTITIRDCASVASDDNNDNDDDIVNIPDDDLPDTGGLPV